MGTGSMVLFGLLEHRMAFQESAVASTRVWAHRLWDPIAFGTWGSGLISSASFLHSCGKQWRF